MRRQVQRQGGRNVVSVPKSAASRRTVALDHATVAVLRRHQAAQQQEAQTAGRPWEEDGYVFTAPRGNALAPDSLTRLFQRRLRQSGLPPVRLHDLRHGAATLALAAGAELKVVQAMLGHASIVVTADTYASVLPETAHAAAEETAALVLAGMHGKKDRVTPSRRTRPGGVSSGPPRRGIRARRIQRARPSAER
ncbi:tyrosine-type recombinase/integrase [Streptomonospora algeriensis]|uniref:Tyrosine-type recombinase/integrase n=1 Tax=Streptomonospora algeriensis TaxID=995084 RepID=A0ABW3BA09_9ACTN